MYDLILKTFEFIFYRNLERQFLNGFIRKTFFN